MSFVIRRTPTFLLLQLLLLEELNKSAAAVVDEAMKWLVFEFQRLLIAAFLRMFDTFLLPWLQIP